MISLLTCWMMIVPVEHLRIGRMKHMTWRPWLLLLLLLLLLILFVDWSTALRMLARTRWRRGTTGHCNDGCSG